MEDFETALGLLIAGFEATMSLDQILEGLDFYVTLISAKQEAQEEKAGV